MAGEGHIPLAATPEPQSAAPISGALEKAETEFDYAMTVTRFRETPRVTKPISDENWQTMLALGDAVDGRLPASDMRLTMGGEPTFVSVDDMEGAAWYPAAPRPTARLL